MHLPILDDAVRPATLKSGATWPNVFTAAQRIKGPRFTTAAYYSWPPLGQLLPRAALNASLLTACSSCEQCMRVEPALVANFTQALRRKKYGLSWLYIDALDECGHAQGGNSASYPAIVQKVDFWVGQVVDALQAARMLERTALLVVSDHGRDAPTGRGHGAFTTAELSVQWLLLAPGVHRGTRLKSPVSIMDAAPTLLHALGVPAPVQMYGRVVREAWQTLGRPPRFGTDGASSSMATPLYALSQAETAAGMREAASLPAAGVPEAPASGSGGARAALTAWHSTSLSVGILLGSLLSVVGVLGYQRLLRLRQEEAHVRSLAGHLRRAPGPATRHPAAHRLRAAAGTCSPDEEEFPLFTRE